MTAVFKALGKLPDVRWVKTLRQQEESITMLHNFFQSCVVNNINISLSCLPNSLCVIVERNCTFFALQCSIYTLDLSLKKVTNWLHLSVERSSGADGGVGPNYHWYQINYVYFLVSLLMWEKENGLSLSISKLNMESVVLICFFIIFQI